MLVLLEWFVSPVQILFSRVSLQEFDQDSSNIFRLSFFSNHFLHSSSYFCFLHSSSDFKVPPSLYQSFGNCTKSTNYNWYYCHFHVPQLFQFPGEIELLIFLFTFFQFYSVFSRESKVHHSAASLSFWLLLGVVVALRLHCPFDFMRFYYYYYSLRVFPTSINWWFFIGVWVTTSLVKSPGLFSVFSPISAMFSLVLLFPSPLVLLSIISNPSARAGYDTRSIFKQNLTDFNSEFSFS